MDSQISDRLVRRGYEVLREVNHEIRWPTAIGLLCDILGVVDWVATLIISKLKEDGDLTIDSGGWINVIRG